MSKYKVEVARRAVRALAALPTARTAAGPSTLGIYSHVAPTLHDEAAQLVADLVLDG